MERIEEDAEVGSRVFDQFRKQQTTLGGEVTPVDKATLKEWLHLLESQLNGYLANEYGVNPQDSAAYDGWRTSHRPFHWFVDFYEIMNKGGFDVIIGNPPYVEYSKVKTDYTIKGFATEDCGNLYAFVVERNKGLCSSDGRTSMNCSSLSNLH